jgi:chorismate mutase
MTIRGIRGATTVTVDTEAAMRPAVVAMMDDLIALNHVVTEDIITLFVTVTDDLHSISPARIIREHYQWDLVPILSAKEPDVTGLPERCIRVLIQCHSLLAAAEIRHVYQHDATLLRPDR